MGKKKNPNRNRFTTADMQPSVDPGYSLEIDPSIAPPQMYWTCLSDNYEEFETVGQCAPYKNFVLKYNKYNKTEIGFTGRGSEHFWKAFKVSQEIIIVDNYFVGNCYDKILEAVLDSCDAYDYRHKDIKIFISNDKKARADLAKAINNSRNMSQELTKYVDIAFYMIKESFVHDRFALMDNYLWHCGATIGGMHKAVTAITGGWPDKYGKFRKFIADMVKEKRFVCSIEPEHIGDID